ncbi:MAG: hypothetical protein ACTSVV_15085 [Promethearchaeota archaeon]
MEILDQKFKIYLIIPAGCICFWAFLALYIHDFYIDPIDFSAYYGAGKYIFSNPELVYGVAHPSYFYYLPGIIMFFSIFSFWSMQVSAWIYYFILIIIAILSIYEFDIILKLKGINNKYIRLMCLLVISNGHRYFLEFDLLNVKIILMFLIIVFIKREVRYRLRENTDMNLKHLLLQTFILGIFISMTPPFIFLSIIFLLNNTNLKRIFSRQQLLKYGLFLIVILTLNFIIFIYPSLVVDFFNSGFGQANIITDPNFNFTGNYIDIRHHLLPTSTLSVICSFLKLESTIAIILSIGLMSIFTLFISFKQNCSLENKFALFFLFSFIFNVYIKTSYFLFMIPPVVLIFMDQLELGNLINPNKGLVLCFKENVFFLLNIFCLFLLNFIPPITFMYKYFSNYLSVFPVYIVIPLWSYLFFIIISCGAILYNKNKNKIRYSNILQID